MRPAYLLAALVVFLTAPALGRAVPAQVETALAPTGDLWLWPRASRPPRLDGDLSGWDWRAPMLDWQQATMVAPWGYQDPPAGSDEQISGVGNLCWDEQYLYLAARIKDSQRCGAPPGEVLRPAQNQGGLNAPWEYDGLMLSLQPAGYLYACGRYQPRTIYPYEKPLWGLNYYPPGGQPRSFEHGSHYVVKDTAEGYDLTAALAWAELGGAARVGDRFLLGTILVDNDRRGAGAGGQVTPRFAQLALYWHHNRPVRLAGPEGVSGDVFPLQAAYDPADPVILKGELDGLAGGARLESVWVQRPGGPPLLEAAVAQEAPAGQTLAFTSRWPAGSLPPGDYQAGLTVRQGGKLYAGALTADLRVRAAPAPAPLAPGSAYTPGEWRPSFSAPYNWRPVRQDVATPDDEVKYFQQVFALDLPGLKNAAEQAAPYPWAYDLAQKSAAMYRLTKDPTYAHYALELIKKQLAYLHGLPAGQGWVPPGETLGTWGEAARWIGDCPDLTAADQELLHKTWFVELARYADRYVGHNRERGAMNRSLYLAVVFMIALAADPTC